MKILARVYWLICALLAAGILCGFFADLNSPGGHVTRYMVLHPPTPTPTFTPTLTPTPAATATVVPTATPTAPATATPTATPTAMPTATPLPLPTAPPATPTVAPASGYSPEEIAYRQELSALLGDYAIWMQGLGANFSTVSSQPEIVLNSDWRIQIATYLVFIRDGDRRVRELNAPPRFASMHADLLAMADDYDRMVDNLTAGIDSLDTGRILQGMQDMQAGNEHVDAARAKADALSLP